MERRRRTGLDLAWRGAAIRARRRNRLRERCGRAHHVEHSIDAGVTHRLLAAAAKAEKGHGGGGRLSGVHAQKNISIFISQWVSESETETETEILAAARAAGGGAGAAGGSGLRVRRCV